MAVKAHCVVCGNDNECAGEVAFADYDPDRQTPLIIGWSNSLGVTAPEGVGEFCSVHLEQAQKLREYRSAEAVRRLRAIWRQGLPGGGPVLCVVSGCDNEGGAMYSNDGAYCYRHARELQEALDIGRSEAEMRRAEADAAETAKRLEGPDTCPSIDISGMTEYLKDAPHSSHRIGSAIRRLARWRRT